LRVAAESGGIYLKKYRNKDTLSPYVRGEPVSGYLTDVCHARSSTGAVPYVPLPRLGEVSPFAYEKGSYN
jgi:hypothetical protein